MQMKHTRQKLKLEMGLLLVHFWILSLGHADKTVSKKSLHLRDIELFFSGP